METKKGPNWFRSAQRPLIKRATHCGQPAPAPVSQQQSNFVKRA
jgi:hypothetical protein